MTAAPDPTAELGPRLGVGREAEVYAWGDDAVVKLYRPGFPGHGAEAVALASLEGHHVAPSLLDVVDRDGRRGLVLERVAGSDMIALLLRRPSRVRVMARALAETHLAVHAVRAPDELPDTRQVLAERIGAAVLPPHLRGFAMRILDGLPSGESLCHGDYHPGNVMVAGGRLSVIDWTNASRGAPEADHARTMLLLRWAAPPPRTPLVARGLVVAGRSVFVRGYARTYADGSRRPLEQAAPWLVVHTAARLAEDIEGERTRLVGLLERAWRARA